MLTTWVQCQQCYGWYHCSCVVVSSRYFEKGNNYFLCCDKDKNAAEPMYIYFHQRSCIQSFYSSCLIRNCTKYETVRTVGIMPMDVYSYQVMGFLMLSLFLINSPFVCMVSTLLPSSEWIIPLSAQTFSYARKLNWLQACQEMSRFHRSLNNSCSLDGKTVVLPCKVE